MKEQCKLINGIPHFGIWFGKSCFYHESLNASDILELQFKLENSIHFPDLEIRNKQIIHNPPGFSCNPLNQNCTVGIKFIAWGRAFKVMRYLKKGVLRYSKKIIGGKRKFKRIDK